MKNLIHQLVLGVLCSFFVWLSFGWFVPVQSVAEDEITAPVLLADSHTHAQITDSKNQNIDVRTSQELHPGDIFQSFDRTGVEVHFPGGARVRLAPETRMQLPPLAGTPLSVHELLLLEGEAWVTTLGATIALHIYVPQGVGLVSNDTSFDVARRGGLLTIFAARNPVRANLFLPDQSRSEFFSNEKISVLNSVLVTEGNVLSFILNKIQPKFEKLLYSKLIKEFQYAAISPPDLAANTWFQYNLELDSDVRNLRLKEFTDDIKNRNLVAPNPDALFEVFKSSFRGFRDYLTFDPVRRQQQVVRELLADLDDALYFASVSQEEKARERIARFLSRASKYSADGSIMKELDDAVWTRFHRFSLLFPRDGALFQIRTELRTALLGLNQGEYMIAFDRAMSVMHSYLFDVHHSLASDTSQSRNFLQQYFQAFSRFLLSYSSDIKKRPDVLMEENQLLTQLYLASPIFYKDQYVEQKIKLEQQWLSLLSDPEDKREETQSLLFAKIDLMKRLRMYFFDEIIVLDDTRSVLLRLLAALSQAPEDVQDRETAKLFRDAVREQQSFWFYLNSSEFAESSVHGANHKERFVAFTRDREVQAELQTLQKNLFGSAFSDIPQTPEVKQTLLDIQNAFKAVGVGKLRIAPLLDKDQPEVFIESAEYNGIVFSAIYDRERSIVSDLNLYGETVLSSAIPLAKLPGIFRVQISSNGSNGASVSSDQNDAGDSSVSNPSAADESLDKVVRVFLQKKFTELGFDLDIGQIRLHTPMSRLYSITEARLPFDKNPVVTSFILDLNQYKVSDVTLMVLDRQVSMPGIFPLDGLGSAITSFYEKAFYEATAVTP